MNKHRSKLSREWVSFLEKAIDDGLVIKDIADACVVHTPTVYMWIHGKHVPSREKCVMYAKRIKETLAKINQVFAEMLMLDEPE